MSLMSSSKGSMSKFKIPQKSKKNLLSKFELSAKLLSGHKSGKFLNKIDSVPKPIEPLKKKEHRTRSHDPTSVMRFRGSIQPLQSNEKISVNYKKRTNSERKKRDKSNATMANSNFLPQIHSHRNLVIAPEMRVKQNKKLSRNNVQKKMTMEKEY